VVEEEKTCGGFISQPGGFFLSPGRVPTLSAFKHWDMTYFDTTKFYTIINRVLSEYKVNTTYLSS
jgi:hypothetical protein